MAILKTPKKLNDERIREMAEDMARNTRRIYQNKSSDEFKMKGDIRKSPNYSAIEKLVVGLKSLKRFPSSEANDMNKMFNTLHRPIWSKMVKDYLAKPTERNTVYTFYFTTGYRILRGELARIYASTEATDKGVVYKPDKFARKEFILRFIRYYDEKLDDIMERAIKDNERVKRPVQEGAVTTIANETVDVASLILNFIGGLFKHAMELNPVSFISACLSRSYDKKVEKFEEVADLYEATIQAYEDYKKLPDNKRSEKIESNYVRNIEKYNIKMNNLKAKIEHFDQRAIDETESVKTSSPQTVTSTTTEKKEPSANDEKTDENPSTSANDNDGFDF